MSTIICCGCEHEGPDRSKCGKWDGHPGACQCDCHAATFVAVCLNRAEVREAIRAAWWEGVDTDNLPPFVDFLCKRWGIDK